MHSSKIGLMGEKLAAKYLKKQKYKIIEVNYTTKFGEIDIIAMKDNILAFVEVKSSERESSVPPSMRVNFAKQQKYRLIASFYVGKMNFFDKVISFDIIEVVGGEVNHIMKAF